MIDSVWIALLLLAVGVIAGTLNVLAGGGSLLSLPVLIFVGLPSVEANGTNRVAILMQNVVATWRFQQHRVVPWATVLWAAIPAVIGSLAGARLALLLDDRSFQRVLAWIMVAATLWSLWTSRSSENGAPLEAAPGVEPSGTRWTLALGFLGVGVYGGFVQAGVGFLILAALSMAGIDLVRGNAVKVVSVLCFTVVALAVFALNGQVDWVLGGVLGIGNSLGAILGVRLTVLKGHVWVERFVMATVMCFAVALWVRS